MRGAVKRARAQTYNVVCTLLPAAAGALPAQALAAPDARDAFLARAAFDKKALAVADDAAPVAGAAAYLARLRIAARQRSKAAGQHGQPSHGQLRRYLVNSHRGADHPCDGHALRRKRHTAMGSRLGGDLATAGWAGGDRALARTNAPHTACTRGCGEP